MTSKPEQKQEVAVVAKSLPDLSSFDLTKVKKVETADNAGTVIGLDHDVWASAWVDLSSKPDRLARSRGRLEAAGYQVAPGYTVAGVRNAEVWVLPRAMYIQRHAAKARALRQLVFDGSRSDAATIRPNVTYKPPGKSGFVDMGEFE